MNLQFVPNLYLSDNQIVVADISNQKFATAEECSKLRKFVPEKNGENMDRLENELKKMR